MSSHNNSSTAANDPRQPYTAKPFVAPTVSAQDLPVDYSGFIAVIFGIAGIMFRVRALILFGYFIQEMILKFCLDLCNTNHGSVFFFFFGKMLIGWPFGSSLIYFSDLRMRAEHLLLELVRKKLLI